MSNVRTLVLPILAAVGTIIVVGVAFKIYISWSKKKKKSVPILLVDPVVKYSLPLIEKDIISHDTRKFRFGLPTPDHVLGLPIGQHVHLTAKIGEEVVIRSYTPVSSDDDRGYVDLVIKVYFKNVHPKFPEGGKLSQYLENMKIGDTIDFRGPSGRLVYKGNGKIAIKLLRKEPPVEYNVKKMIMLAGGTGITPMLQLIRAIVKDPTDETQVSLLYANQTEKDILLRDELDDVAKKYPNRVKVWYTVDTSSEGWSYSTGYINADMIERHTFPPSPDTIVLMCGPPPMINFACTPNLEKLGYDSKLRFAY
ncbi:NADH-cytochrome b5 reductase 3 isoform X2 [Ooceraea biroi]|uniref:NADH-cytochrome b5 reductase 3 isoform X2 n=1 Tax=Ooceraea biroi TaxID=2015173 RepID=UPI0005BD4B0E|nr:NADH-cytochrome b5 reductase 3 isoform X2 [Ooceraea biroi]XP_026830006.1 NADH-cytochrome b5 reductase 3 isoform X2 [Ooceraea biroi]XP_026830007.1 NADH-cytochrome b5 reductase 3 isoform X2 [Ooceraea biroi]